MNQKLSKKLALNKETIRTLSEREPKPASEVAPAHPTLSFILSCLPICTITG